ncbi:hypothetical protein [Sulfitobacter sp.]|uniref:hypothetical protein n=1 Tax=Sulfitobacter sp. TaxID=1903071 RepID=UPI0030036322
MADHASESQKFKSAIDDREYSGAELTFLTELDSIEAEDRDATDTAAMPYLDRLDLDALDLGEGPFFPEPDITVEELAQLQDAENREELEAKSDVLARKPAPDAAPVSSPQAAQPQHRDKFLAALKEPKPKTSRKFVLSPRQLEIIAYRKGPEGRPLWNDYQKAQRWKKAEEEGRVIVPRKNLKAMTPEEKASHIREQAAQASAGTTVRDLMDAK